MHPYIGLRATSQPYEIWPIGDAPVVTGTIVHVDGPEVVLLLDDGRHTSRRLTRIVMADPAEAARRLNAKEQ